MRVSALFVSAALFAGALAAPMPGGTEYEFEQCNGGEIQCCNSTKSVQSLEWTTKSLLGLLGIDLKQITGLVGTECTSLNVLGIGGGSKCTQQKVCCNNNSFNGVIALGCSPINIGL